MSDTQTTQLHLLGSFLITSYKPVPTLRRKTRALLAYLAATGQAHPRSRLMDLFCQGANAPSRALAVLLSRIRKQLGSDVLITDRRTVRLNETAVWVDVASFRAVLGGDMDVPALSAVETAVSYYRADLLTGLTLNNAPEFELWLLGERAQMRHLLERGLMKLVQHHSEQNLFGMALPYAQQLVQHNPLLEEAHAQLIWLYAHMGQHDAAIAQYAQCRTLLQQELAIEPGESLQKLMANLEAERPFSRDYEVKTATSTVLSAGVSIQTKSVNTDFVGRKVELATLNTAWQQTKAGQGGVVTISAHAGGGKTRLVQELIGQVAESHVLVGRCYESNHALPYEPWLGLLDQHLQRLNEAAIERLLPQTRMVMARLLPQLARRLSQDHVVEQIGTFVETGQLFTAVIDFLNQPTNAPMLLFIDDLQWADEASLRLFHYVSQRIARLPWLLVGAYRSEEAANSPALTMLIDDFARRGVARLAMQPFSASEITELTTHFWPQLAPGYRGHVAEMLAQATGGNALFVTAVLRELATSDTLPSDLPVPASVRDLVQRRLRRMPVGCRQVLEGLAVLDAAATLTQLQHVSGRSVDEVTQAVELGLQLGLVVAETAVSPAQYQFHHDLLREAVLVSLSSVRVQRLHHRTATWLAHMADCQPTTVQEELAGRILVHAQQGEAYALQFRWAMPAAAHARHMFAYRDALDLLELGLDAFVHCQLLPDFDVRAAETAVFEMIILWLAHCVGVGKPDEQVEAMFQQAKQLLEKHPSRAREAHLYLAETIFHTDYRLSITAANKAHRLFLHLEQPERAASALLIVAASYLSLSENRRSQQAFSDALALYQQAGDVAGKVQSLSGLGWVALNLGEVEAALHHLQQGLALSRERGDRIGEAQSLFVLAAAWGFYHAPQQMIESAQAAIAVYEEIGFAGRAIRPLLYTGLAYDMQGDTAQALSIYEQVLPQAVDLLDTWVIGWVSQMIGRIYLECGDVQAAAEHLQMAQQTRIKTGEVQNQVSDLAWLGRLALAQGDMPQALALTEQAISQLDAFDGEFYVWEQPDVLMCRAEALLAAGDVTAASAVVERAHETLCHFAEQISDLELRERFFKYRRNVGVVTAYKK